MDREGGRLKKHVRFGGTGLKFGFCSFLQTWAMVGVLVGMRFFEIA